jgi:hypothetical protein
VTRTTRVVLRERPGLPDAGRIVARGATDRDHAAWLDGAPCVAAASAGTSGSTAILRRARVDDDARSAFGPTFGPDGPVRLGRTQ